MTTIIDQLPNYNLEQLYKIFISVLQQNNDEKLKTKYEEIRYGQNQIDIHDIIDEEKEKEGYLYIDKKKQVVIAGNIQHKLKNYRTDIEGRTAKLINTIKEYWDEGTSEWRPLE